MINEKVNFFTEDKCLKYKYLYQNITVYKPSEQKDPIFKESWCFPFVFIWQPNMDVDMSLSWCKSAVKNPGPACCSWRTFTMQGAALPQKIKGSQRVLQPRSGLKA